MRTHIRILLAITVISPFSPVETAFAGILEYANIHLGDDYMNGDCELIISDDEPFSQINAHCNLDKDNNLTDLHPGTKITGRNLLGYKIGWPRSNPNGLESFFWGLLTLVNPVANSTYCVRFGEWWDVDDPEDVLRVTYGHHSDPSKNETREGKADCDEAEPKVKAYYQTYCLGSFVWVYSVDSIIPGVHFSHRLKSDLLICHAVATFPDN